MPAADFAAVAALKAEVRDVPRQTDVLRNGDQPSHVVVVLSGLLHRYTIGPEGKRQIHSFYLPNEAPASRRFTSIIWTIIWPRSSPRGSA